jgi:hypothetical protein
MREARRPRGSGVVLRGRWCQARAYARRVYAGSYISLLGRMEWAMGEGEGEGEGEVLCLGFATF